MILGFSAKGEPVSVTVQVETLSPPIKQYDIIRISSYITVGGMHHIKSYEFVCSCRGQILNPDIGHLLELLEVISNCS